jgi:LacI family transcriptional regulator
MVSAWKNISIKKIAKESGFGTATVDRVLNNRLGVSEKSKKIINVTLEKLLLNPKEYESKKILVCCESGPSYNKTLENEIIKKNIEHNLNFFFTSYFIPAKEFTTSTFSKLILDHSSTHDGLIIVAQEDTLINQAVQKFTFENKPVVTLTTDLPNSNRTAYVGSEQSNAGSTAAYLIGSQVKKQRGSVLMVMSMPYRCQQERELGFRKVLRSEFPNIKIKESVYSSDTSEESYKHVKNYIRDNGPPLAIYNISGGNLGIAEAIKENHFNNQVIFVGHELNINSKNLLETNQMHYVIGHDVGYEVEQSFNIINNYYKNEYINNIITDVKIYTKYNCLNKAVY